MNSSTANFPVYSSAEQYNIQSNSNFRDADFFSQKYHMAAVADLYSKNEDEPDFDCEFLYGIDGDFDQKENINELESQQNMADSAIDYLWTADLHTAYLQ